MLALRYLRARRKEGFISVIAGFSFLGIMLGVATLIIVMAVMNGFRQELFDKILGLNGHVVVHSLAPASPTTTTSSARIRAVPGVKFALPLVEGQVMAVDAVDVDRRAGARPARSRPQAAQGRSPTISASARSTASTRSPASPSARGSPTSSTSSVGDEVTLLSPRGAATALGTAPRVKRYPVVAIFEIGMSEYDASILFMPLNEAQLYFNQPDTVTVLEVVLDSPDEVGKLAPKIVERRRLQHLCQRLAPAQRDLLHRARRSSAT